MTAEVIALPAPMRAPPAAEQRVWPDWRRGALSVSYDPMQGEWLVLEARSVLGMPTSIVVASHPERAEAEAAGGLHDAPVLCWLLQDPLRGWVRPGKAGWTTRTELAALLTEAEARDALRVQPQLQVLVLREGGRVTCPDLPS